MLLRVGAGVRALLRGRAALVELGFALADAFLVERRVLPLAAFGGGDDVRALRIGRLPDAIDTALQPPRLPSHRLTLARECCGNSGLAAGRVIEGRREVEPPSVRAV